MSIDRAPIKRPTVDGLTSDQHGRIRALEAGQTMPYCVGSVKYTWPANTTPPGVGSNDDSTWYVRFDPTQDCYAPDGGDDSDRVCFDSTDLSILASTPLNGMPDQGGCIFTWGGGLFYWQGQVRASGQAWTLSENLANDGQPYGVSSKLVPSYITEIQPVSGGYASADIAYFNGLYSPTGYFANYDPNASQQPGWGGEIDVVVSKSDPTQSLVVYVQVFCARWTPVGFAHWIPE